MAADWPGMAMQAKREWGEVPDGPFEQLERRREWFVYLFELFKGMTREEAEREANRWIAADESTAEG